MRVSLAVALVPAALIWGAAVAQAQQSAPPPAESAPAAAPAERKAEPAAKGADAQPGAPAVPAPSEKPAEPEAVTKAAPAEPKPRPVPQAQKPECRWLGARTLRVLLRDDLIAAEGFQRVYKSFGCPADHLGRAFGCAVPAASIEAANALEAYVEACWKDPAYLPPAAAPAQSGQDGANRGAQPPAQAK